MAKPSKNKIIIVKGEDVSAYEENIFDYISLTDIVKYGNNRAEMVIQNWTQARITIEWLGFWESLINPNFKHIGFDLFKKQADLSGLYGRKANGFSGRLEYV
jgi:uncharacterized protein YkwD